MKTKTITTIHTPQEISRILSNHVLDTMAPKFAGHVSATLIRVPSALHHDYWDFKITLTLTPERKRKASK